MNDYHINGNAIILLSPGEVHSYYLNRIIQGTSVFFTENYFSSLSVIWSNYLKYDILHKIPCLELESDESKSKVKSAFRVLQKEMELFSERRNNYIGVYSALTLLLYCISETAEFLHLVPKVELAQRKSRILYFSFLGKVEKLYSQCHSVQHYARELRVSVNKLEDCCKECAGEKPTAIICRRIMLEAKRLLIYTLLSSKEISNRLGFVEQSHFANYFKKNANISPTEFRKQYGMLL